MTRHHEGCEQAEDEIDRLRAEIEAMKGAVDDATREFLKELDRAQEAEARLAAVIALCDDHPDWCHAKGCIRPGYGCIEDCGNTCNCINALFRAAATGDTK